MCQRMEALRRETKPEPANLQCRIGNDLAMFFISHSLVLKGVPLSLSSFSRRYGSVRGGIRISRDTESSAENGKGKRGSEFQKLFFLLGRRARTHTRTAHIKSGNVAKELAWRERRRRNV